MQGEVNAEPKAVAEARRRRDMFRDAFDGEFDVVRTLPSGSLARGSQIEPINDVDLVMVFSADDHPTWGRPGASAGEALDELQNRVRELLGVTEGTFAQEVRLAKPRNHAVKCWLDDPEEEGAFTVDVSPALEVDGQVLLIPERQGNKWIETAPEDLIDRVAARHAAWRYFVPLARVLKRWNREQAAGMKSLAVEVLALNHLPEGERPRALARFFAAAATAVVAPIEDPAGLCGEIQPDLDRNLARKRLEAAADTAWRAVGAETEDPDRAACLWREVFGDVFPAEGCDGGKAAVTVGATVVRRPRPVRDAPQG